MVQAKLPINGLKISPRLALIDLLSEDKSISLGLYRFLSGKRLNVSFATVQMQADRWRGTCCIQDRDLEQVRPLLESRGGTAEIREGVATLTLFPHRSRFDLLDRLMAAFAAAKLPLYAVGSSMSTLILVTDFERLTDAVAAVETVAQLPENHSPFQTDLRVRQI